MKPTVSLIQRYGGFATDEWVASCMGVKAMYIDTEEIGKVSHNGRDQVIPR